MKRQSDVCPIGLKIETESAKRFRESATCGYEEEIPRYPIIGESLEVVSEYPRLYDARSWDDIPPSFWESTSVAAITNPRRNQDNFLDTPTELQWMDATESIIVQDHQEPRGERKLLGGRYGMLIMHTMPRIPEHGYPPSLPLDHREEDKTSNVSKNNMSGFDGMQEDIPEID